MISTSNNPFPAKVLGWSGLIPFVALTLASTQTVGSHFGPVSFALTVYAGIILSFLGGIQWGLAIGARNAGRLTDQAFCMLLTMSVAPSLVAWAGVFLWKDMWGIMLLATGYFLALATDHWSHGKGLIPRWFYLMRFLLTFVVILCLTVVAIGKPISI